MKRACRRSLASRRNRSSILKGYGAIVPITCRGFPVVGDVTAVKLIQQYGSFDAIVEAAKTMTSKVGEKHPQ
jgi:hypothetical protein